jgi:SecD/SecF fusion protein
LRTRIDQFGVAQPSINPDRNRGIDHRGTAGCAGPGAGSPHLQSSANLQFWEVYNVSELINSITKADEAFVRFENGKAAGDTSVVDSATLAAQSTSATISSSTFPQNGQPIDNGQIGYVNINDTMLVRSFIDAPAVRNAFPADIVFAYGVPDVRENKKMNFVALYGLKTYGRDRPKLEGDAITDARADFNQTNSRSEVTMKMSPSGARIWADMTGANIGRAIAIVLDNNVYSAPNVNDKIEGGSSSISGSFTPQEATDLANNLKIGKLPAPAKILQERVVGPTLGANAIHGGIMAFAISFLVIFLLMLVYYNTSGWVANIALILNLLFTIGILTGLGATLTAPGIAGLVLTIGMAVDTNVIIYERIKEELTRGKTYVQAVSEGYRRSLPPVLDAHVTTLLTAIILFSFGLGPVKGFATTQIIGICCRCSAASW